MKKTAFTEKHIALGAKMAEFAGYNMPISYSGINDEHAAVRNNAGIFDVSHMGEFILKGERALGGGDTLRLEMGCCLYGTATDYPPYPREAGLGWFTKISTDFTARPVLE